MTDNVCLNGVRFPDTTSHICTAGTPLVRVCRTGEEVYALLPAGPAWFAAISEVRDERVEGLGLEGPGNATEARVYVGDLSLVYPALTGPGIVNGGCDTALSGGSTPVVDTCASPGPIRAGHVTNGVPTQMRISYVAGFSPVFGYWPSNGVYAQGTWVPYAGEAIFAGVANPALGIPPGNDRVRSAVVLVELDFGATILSANVTLHTHSAHVSYVPP